VQVVSRDYNLKSSVKEGYSVSFYSGGQYPLVFSAICREADNKTVVSITVAQSMGNPQVFFVGKALDKGAAQFWAELDRAITLNQNLKSGSSEPARSEPAANDDSAQVMVKSCPDGADIALDGKFAGSTPSTFKIKSGDHSVRIELKGFLPWEKSLTIAPGGQITLNANLQREPPDAPQ
jgi:hypothetical protein